MLARALTSLVPSAWRSSVIGLDQISGKRR